MRAVFGVISLMIVVGLVGMLAGRQLTAMRGAAAPATAAAASAPATVRAQSQMQDKAVSDITKALEQGAARREEADK